MYVRVRVWCNVLKRTQLAASNRISLGIQTRQIMERGCYLTIHIIITITTITPSWTHQHQVIIIVRSSAKTLAFPLIFMRVCTAISISPSLAAAAAMIFTCVSAEGFPPPPTPSHNLQS